MGSFLRAFFGADASAFSVEADAAGAAWVVVLAL